MSRDALQESLSAVMDNEADDWNFVECSTHLMTPKPVIPGLVTKSLGR